MSDRGSVVRMQLQGESLGFVASVPGEKTEGVTGSMARARIALGPGKLTEAGLESAIAEVEELVMPILRGMPAGATLEIGGAELAGIFGLLSEDPGAAISLESVERLFNQLASHAAGSHVAWREPVPATQVALGLVVLREVMHHGGFGTFRFSPRAT